jgi:hypothetical protein
MRNQGEYPRLTLFQKRAKVHAGRALDAVFARLAGATHKARQARVPTPAPT